MMKTKKQNIFARLAESITANIKKNIVFYSACVASFILALVFTYFTFISGQNFSAVNLADFAVNKVAEKNVVSNRTLQYTDEEATEIKKNAKKQSILPVFVLDNEITANVQSQINTFCTKFPSADAYATVNDFTAAVQETFPNVFSINDLNAVYNKELAEKTEIISSLAKQIMGTGYIKVPEGGEIVEYKTDEIELITKVNNTQNFSTVKIDNLLTREKIRGFVEKILLGMGKENYTADVIKLLMPFLQPNILYDRSSTERKVQAALQEVAPVTVVIPEGEVIIKQGYIVSEEDYDKLKKLTEVSFYFDRKLMLGWTLFLIIIFGCSSFLFSHQVLDSSLSTKNRLILLVSSALVYIISLFLSQLNFITNEVELMTVMPVTFFTMLIAILISKKVAVLHAIILSLIILVPVNFNFYIATYTLFSSFIGVAFIHISDKRIDLIKTALELTVVNPILAASIVLLFGIQAQLLRLLVGTAINGFMTGIFLLGFLPILETALNIPTNFRLMELSDLNGTVLKRMLLTVPGTYNHSILVASLAEAACRAIGANPLLARVGAYYHDIGKMENPEYFVENQTEYNKHSDLTPRLSATVIRSHTKLGVAQAKDLHLPDEVIEMIATHHGNGLISFFYYKALELEGDGISKADFSYPGPKPKSKEASVVMLADTVEAACRAKIASERTNDLEGFFTKTIDELVKAKIDADQLTESLLTLSEITTVKKSFVEILTGYYHSRIDYPKAKKPSEGQAKPNSTPPDTPAPAANASAADAPASSTQDSAADAHTDQTAKKPAAKAAHKKKPAE